MGSLSLPFTVEPVAMPRAELWGQFLSTATTMEELSVANRACGALWYEAAASHECQEAMECVAQGDMSWAVRWLGHLGDSLQKIGAYWSEVVTALGGSGGVARPYVRDAQRQAFWAGGLLAEVVSFTEALCEVYALPLPAEVQHYLAALTPVGQER
jgi:hypothetical protein